MNSILTIAWDVHDLGSSICIQHGYARFLQQMPWSEPSSETTWLIITMCCVCMFSTCWSVLVVRHFATTTEDSYISRARCPQLVRWDQGRRPVFCSSWSRAGRNTETAWRPDPDMLFSLEDAGIYKHPQTQRVTTRMHKALPLTNRTTHENEPSYHHSGCLLFSKLITVRFYNSTAAVCWPELLSHCCDDYFNSVLVLKHAGHSSWRAIRNVHNTQNNK